MTISLGLRVCRPKRDEDLAVLARTHTEDAIAALVSIVNDPKVNPSGSNIGR